MIWKDVVGYEGLYEVSSEGEVRNSSGKVMSPYKHKGKWLKVSLWNGVSKKNYPVHRLVAIAFIPNPLNKPEINHKIYKKMTTGRLTLNGLLEKKTASTMRTLCINYKTTLFPYRECPI